MDQSSKLIDVVLVGCCSNIPLLVPVPFDHSIHRGHHHVMPNVELSRLVQERLRQVLLDNVGFLSSVVMSCLAFKNLPYLVQVTADLDSISSIG